MPAWLRTGLQRRGHWDLAARGAAEGPRIPLRDSALVRTGDADRLRDEMIERFPVEGYGQRNDRMVPVLASLLGRSLGPRLAYAVTEAWWQHFSALGLIRTLTSEAPRLVGAAIRSILRSPNFRVAPQADDHRSACRLIRLSTEQRRLLDTKLEELARLEGIHQRERRPNPKNPPLG